MLTSMLAYSTESLQGVVDRYADMIFRISLTQLKNWHDAEDITQTAFIKLLENRPSFESEEHVKAWLIRVTINLCNDYLKSAWSRRTVQLHEEIYGSEIEISDITRAIMKLTPKNRLIIVLHYYVGYTISEIASIMNQKPTTIAARLHRTRKILKLEIMD